MKKLLFTLLIISPAFASAQIAGFSPYVDIGLTYNGGENGKSGTFTAGGSATIDYSIIKYLQVGIGAILYSYNSVRFNGDFSMTSAYIDIKPKYDYKKNTFFALGQIGKTFKTINGLVESEKYGLYYAAGAGAGHKFTKYAGIYLSAKVVNTNFKVLVNSVENPTNYNNNAMVLSVGYYF
ncbi:outer membrane beta-barrel protein [Taibaiella lutea]|uniref:Outer membrane beta-barrel protein n=1 Tax=Taibaiella lutea TaxID=2608001 RepID=A0A5M6CE15_9BACT|nr:outer membrane beta-barrel protein [Taibaiella lutea]KAA5532700.1 outer membrane beta-barrel protein [Taibaiella lutea]